MKTLSIAEFRKRTSAVFGRIAKGETFVLTYRGRPAARLEPLGWGAITEDDPIYALAESASDAASSLTNAEIDETDYGI